MIKTKIDLYSSVKYLIPFFSFIGFYAVIAFFNVLGFNENTLFYTFPTRLLVVILMIIVILAKHFKPSKSSVSYLLFIIFFGFYFLRVISESFIKDSDFYIQPYEIIVYSIIYVIIPFFYFSQKKTNEDFKRIFYSIITSGIIFSVFAIYLYVQFKFSGKSWRSALPFNPLIFSYPGALLAGVSLSRIAFRSDPLPRKELLLYLFATILGLIILFIGTSRGPFIALILTFLIYFIYFKKLKIKKSYLIYSIVSVLVLVFLDSKFGFGTIQRVFGTLNDISEGKPGAVRIDIWGSALKQFIKSPLIGSSIQTESGAKAHNILLEVLMSTGILGFLPFLFLMILGIKKSFNLIKQYPEYAWVSIFFSQALIKNMLSGALYNSILYWSGLALLLSLNSDHLLEQKTRNE